jgi:hypothetical protein
MRFNILSINPEIINTSTMEEDKFFVSKTIVTYEIIGNSSPIKRMQITAEFEGEITIEVIQNFIKKEHERPSITK